MKIPDLFDDEEDVDYEDIDTSNLDVSTFTSFKLCEIIIFHRYLGFNEALATKAMTELANRRANGDVYDFESQIDSEIKKLPELDFKLPDFNQMLKAASEFNK